MTASDVLGKVFCEGSVDLLETYNEILRIEATDRGDSFYEKVFYDENGGALFVGNEAL